MAKISYDYSLDLKGMQNILVYQSLKFPKYSLKKNVQKIMSELQLLASCSSKLKDTNWLHGFAFHAKNNQSMIL